MHSIAFYNTENFFEAPKKSHADTDRKWTEKRYAEKLKNIGLTISKIGRAETDQHPTLIGLAEIQGQTVLQDLIQLDLLKDCHYDFVFFKSKDERAMDVALLYDTRIFNVESSRAFSIELFDDLGNREYKRDILLVTGVLNEVKIHVLVNHWPSKRESEKLTEPKRLIASNKVSEIISTIIKEDEKALIIVMGDFNDNPTSKSVKRLVYDFKLQNPFEPLRSFSKGSIHNSRQWHLFDQILLSETFFNPEKNSIAFKRAHIFDAEFLKNTEGKHKGTPKRTFKGPTYYGGYSDHFPVYVILGT
ncbi:endonuclease/exonuclease/phosphatase family protein [Bizionia arctica]|uniref:Endonuclease n=1 Tax=Bizionia arctica TaxID=1495645 RepID=A0A917GCZ6_9FLAO|nr:endonuclease [Bizionia arctica]GGG38587.1 endonuclease [Bizionia arctica]